MNWLFYCISSLFVGRFGSWVLSSLALILDLKIVRVYGLNSDGLWEYETKTTWVGTSGKTCLGVRLIGTARHCREL